MGTKEYSVEIKGQKEGLWIFLNDRLPLHDVFTALKDKLASSNNFFHGAEVTIDTGTRLLTHEEKAALQTIVEGIYALRIRSLTTIGTSRPLAEDTEGIKEKHADSAPTETAAIPQTGHDLPARPLTTGDDTIAAVPENRALPLEQQESVDTDNDDEFMKFLDETFRIPVKGGWVQKETYSSDYLYENEETAFYFRGTVRSGQSLEFSGNIIILGDVNPGAYVIASGDIIVMGRLHGVVHAGAEGEERAIVIGMNFYPSQLRIAQFIGRPPDEGPRMRDKHSRAEKAYIKDGTIVIEPFL
ncbi:septum site-determining protein MinC [candidate division KSB3 bacterium]|uniref:Probable septum site-determining protein MinC n=1 Tax=candidate division KSB3 bacterium TaxID=2044937 RepID=A0A2G6E3I0_9BACT|nr:MAG: septum site-determining protein MinC [candidate division KSB3 bacterium]PIE29166.1 MAG: septum site-determining protein MinC [candidate division KSB3 bacterium]